MIDFWWQIHVYGPFHIVEAQVKFLLCMITCLPTLARQILDVGCQVPHPSLTTTVKSQWFWRHKHQCLFTKWTLYFPGARTRTLPFPHLCAFYRLSSLIWQQSRHTSLHAPCPLSSQRFDELSHAAGPSYQATVNLGRGASRSTSNCWRCLVSTSAQPWLSLFLPVPARRRCLVCHPRVHVFEQTLSKSCDLLLECLIH